MKKVTAQFAMTVASALLAGTQVVDASSHREAPGIAEDQYADNTDVYAFISPANADKLVVIANYVPLLKPDSGPNFYKFSDDVRYEVLFDNDGDAKWDVKYAWDFTTEISNGSTFLYNVGPVASIDDANLNVKQFYSLERTERRPNRSRKIAERVPVAPWNVGSRSFPNYGAVANQAIKSTQGYKMFAGPRDEGFFVDLHVFDLLGVGGAKTTDGLNVMSLVLELPITEIAANKVRPDAGDASTKSVVGLYARSLRNRVRHLGRTREPREFGSYIQISRLGWPLINEVIIPLQDKDKFNQTNPADDVDNFGGYIVDPEVPKLLNLVFNAGCPTDQPRTDIVGLLSPAGTAAADMLRINITEDQTYANSGFPNGRKLEDDVVDTLLTVACNNGGAISDGVNGNDKEFLGAFPYLAEPHSGNPK